MFYAGRVLGNNYFYSSGYDGGYGRVGHAETFRERRARWHRLGRFTGVSDKILGPEKKSSIGVEYFVDWLENQKLPWDSYWAFMSGRLIALDKLPGVRPVCVRET